MNFTLKRRRRNEKKIRRGHRLLSNRNHLAYCSVYTVHSAETKNEKRKNQYLCAVTRKCISFSVPASLVVTSFYYFISSIRWSSTWGFCGSPASISRCFETRRNDKQIHENEITIKANKQRHRAAITKTKHWIHSRTAQYILISSMYPRSNRAHLTWSPIKSKIHLRIIMCNIGLCMSSNRWPKSQFANSNSSARDNVENYSHRSRVYLLPAKFV